MSDTPQEVLDLIRKVKEEQLEELDLSQYSESIAWAIKMSSIPDEVFDLEHLKTLRLGIGRIQVIPPQITKLKNLEVLDIHGNEIYRIPKYLLQLSQLKELYFNGNPVGEIPSWIAQMTNLSKLWIGGTDRTPDPTWIGEMVNLTSFMTSHLNYTVLPKWVRQLRNLNDLRFSSCQFQNLPEWLCELSGLENLWIRSSLLITWPEVVNSLHNLIGLGLLSSGLKEVSDKITSLIHLQILSLGDNNLHQLPDTIANLESLNTISLEQNFFQKIPDWMFKLPALEHLYLTDNQIKKIGQEILHAERLRDLDIRRNPLEDPPSEVVYKGLPAIREYYRQRQDSGIDHLYEAKFILLGEGGAGKTSLAKKIVDPMYKLCAEDTTRGIEVLRWSFPLEDGKDFQVNIWDFGGQEIYHATHQFFLTRRSLYALVADMRKEDTDFNYWLQVVELLSDNSPILIIKNEKFGRMPEFNERLLRGRFTNIKEVLATDLADNSGLDEILKFVRFYIEGLPHVGAALPRTWVRVREALEQDPHNYISLETYFEVCEKNGFTQEKDMLQLSGYLHDLGVFLHFQDDPVLRNTVILKPRWGTDAVYRVLDDPGVQRSQGTFTTGDLGRIWSEKGYTRKQPELVQLMMKFCLCYPVPHTEGTYIAPSLLGANQPEYAWDAENNLHLRYQYEFMPKGILTQFIVVMHEHIRDHCCVWKSGVVLEKDGALAEVIEYYDRKEIRVRVAGKNKKTLLDIVDYQLEEIHKSYRQLRYDTYIPCNCSTCRAGRWSSYKGYRCRNCSTCRAGTEPHFYPLKTLKKFIEDRQPKVQCTRSYAMVDVSRLIYDVLDWRRSEEERRERELGNIYADRVIIARRDVIESGGGAVIKGDVQARDIIGRDQQTLTYQSAFAALRQQAAQVEDEVTRQDLEDALERLEQEAAKGEAASEGRVKRYFGLLAEMAPELYEAAVEVFCGPVTGVSPVFARVTASGRKTD